MNIYAYKFDHWVYLSLHMNLVYKEQEQSFNANYLNERFISDIYQFIKDDKEKNYILDFMNIALVASRSFAHFNSLENKNIVFINLQPDSTFGIIKDDIKDSLAIGEERNAIANTTEGKNIIDGLGTVTEVNKKMDKNKIRIIATYIKEHTISGEQYLESSNVYANMYIDVKQVFLENKVYALAIYELCRTMKKHFPGDCCLVSASNNGSTIATAVGRLLKINVLYLRNLGPHVTLHDTQLIEKIIPQQKYVFVFDFICLGTEFKIAKTIVKLKKAALIGAIGIAIYNPPDKEKIISLLKVNETEWNFDYKVIVKEVD
jgi:hypothetical protein